MRWLSAMLIPIILLCRAGPSAATDPSTSRFLSDPSPRDPLEIALDRVAARRGVSRAADAGEFSVRDRYESRHTGTTHIVLRQRIAGIEVWNADIAINVSRDGRVVSEHDRSVTAPGAATSSSPVPSLSAADALRRVAAQLGLAVREPIEILEAVGGAAQEVLMERSGVSLDPIPAKLVWLAGEAGGLRLAWNLQIREPGRSHWWDLCADAETGEVLWRAD